MPEITELESEIIDMIIEGKEKTKIARDLGIARSWLYKILNKEPVQAELEARRIQLRKAANDKITGRIDNLVDNMLDMAMKSTDQRVKYNANKYLLDRALGVPTTIKEDNSNDNANKPKDKNDLKADLDNIKKMRVVK